MARRKSKSSRAARKCVAQAISHGLKKGKHFRHAVAYALGKCRSQGYRSLGVRPNLGEIVYRRVR